jgi:hypothetical protein
VDWHVRDRDFLFVKRSAEQPSRSWYNPVTTPGSKQAAMSQKPVAIGLLLCEQVIIEEKTRNVTPVNCFTQRLVEGFPSKPFPFVVFAVLTDGLGEVRLEVAIQRLDTLEEVYQRTLTARFPHPLREVRCVFRVRDCSFPVAGAYQVMILAEDELLAQKRLVIQQKEASA